ncbi:hypothetical protein QBK99_23050 [Corticibacterium sp. UT-5YL-CI-8]|nr:hypothetical protein [Tianweitania sp. UT-5YL-CI-8]
MLATHVWRHAQSGIGTLFEAFAAVVIGGVSLKAARQAVRVVASVLLLSSIRTAVNLLMMPPHYTQMIQGGLVVTAMRYCGLKGMPRVKQSDEVRPSFYDDLGKDGNMLAGSAWAGLWQGRRDWRHRPVDGGQGCGCGGALVRKVFRSGDGLGHIRHRRLGYYQGYLKSGLTRLTRLTGQPGARLGIEHWARRGIAGRFVLADLDSYCHEIGRPIRQGEANDITAYEVEACLA